MRQPELISYAQILNDIAHNNIKIFQPPAYDLEDEETIAENEEILVSNAKHIRLNGLSNL